MSTPYHVKYFAYELTRQGGEGVERLRERETRPIRNRH